MKISFSHGFHPFRLFDPYIGNGRMRSRQEHGSVRAPDLWVQKKFTQSNRRKGKDGNRDISLSQGKDANAVRTYD